MLHTLRPILVAAPVQRSGTTLIQRLLSSASNTLIYGESCAGDLNMLLGLYQSKLAQFGRQEQWRQDQLAQVLQGQVNDWIPDLMPDTQAYLANWERLLTEFFQYFAGFAAGHGRDHWGVKLPGWNVFQIDQILKMMPQTKVVYIVRDLAECVRSAKLMGFCQDVEATRQFCQFWQMNLQDAQRLLRRDNTLWISYAELTARPEAVIAVLAAFTGAKEIDGGVMGHRINDYHGQLLEPPPLSGEEALLVQQISSRSSYALFWPGDKGG